MKISDYLESKGIDSRIAKYAERMLKVKATEKLYGKPKIKVSRHLDGLFRPLGITEEDND